MLTQDELPPELAKPWLGYQERLAASSSNAIHLRAVGSGHEIHADAEGLELAAITEVVEAARGDGRLAACDDRFAERARAVPVSRGSPSGTAWPRSR